MATSTADLVGFKYIVHSAQGARVTTLDSLVLPISSPVTDAGEKVKGRSR
jgi:hypothetical protein